MTASTLMLAEKDSSQRALLESKQESITKMAPEKDDVTEEASEDDASISMSVAEKVAEIEAILTPSQRQRKTISGSTAATVSDDSTAAFSLEVGSSMPLVSPLTLQPPTPKRNGLTNKLDTAVKKKQLVPMNSDDATATTSSSKKDGKKVKSKSSGDIGKLAAANVKRRLRSKSVDKSKSSTSRSVDKSATPKERSRSKDSRPRASSKERSRSKDRPQASSKKPKSDRKLRASSRSRRKLDITGEESSERKTRSKSIDKSGHTTATATTESSTAAAKKKSAAMKQKSRSTGDIFAGIKKTDDAEDDDMANRSVRTGRKKKTATSTKPSKSKSSGSLKPPRDRKKPTTSKPSKTSSSMASKLENSSHVSDGNANKPKSTSNLLAQQEETTQPLRPSPRPTKSFDNQTNPLNSNKPKSFVWNGQETPLADWESDEEDLTMDLRGDGLMRKMGKEAEISAKRSPGANARRQRFIQYVPRGGTRNSVVSVQSAGDAENASVRQELLEMNDDIESVVVEKEGKKDSSDDDDEEFPKPSSSRDLDTQRAGRMPRNSNHSNGGSTASRSPSRRGYRKKDVAKGSASIEPPAAPSLDKSSSHDSGDAATKSIPKTSTRSAKSARSTKSKSKSSRDIHSTSTKKLRKSKKSKSSGNLLMMANDDNASVSSTKQRKKKKKVKSTRKLLKEVEADDDDDASTKQKKKKVVAVKKKDGAKPKSKRKLAVEDLS